MNRRKVGYFLLLLLSVVSVNADDDVSSSDIDIAEQAVAIEGQVADSRIQQRLISIYNVTDKYNQIAVSVKNGVVFLSGEAVYSDGVEWASSIAENTEGVVAVSNQLSVSPAELLDFTVAYTELKNVWKELVRGVPLVALALLVFLCFYFIARPISSLSVKLVSNVTDSPLIVTVARRILALFVVLLGLYLFFKITGLTQFAVAIISGTGLLGLIVGFAFKDIAENFISSLLLSVQRPFRLNDVIEVDGHVGLVHKVTARGTVLVDFDGNHILVPNATIYKNTIINYTANPKIRSHFIVGIGYDANIKQAQTLIFDELNDNSAVLSDPEPQVLLDELASSTINLKVHFWINAHQYSTFKVTSALMRTVVSRLLMEGVPMPDDAREVVFPDGVPVYLNRSQPIDTFSSPKAPQSDTPVQPKPSVTHVITLDEDLSSDNDDIREQAEAARETELGDNIL